MLQIAFLRRFTSIFFFWNMWSSSPEVSLFSFGIPTVGNRRSFVLLFELMDTSIRLRVVHIPSSLGILAAGTLDSHLFSGSRF
ncbi:hypothetical protein TNCT_112531 [Trichonephila clavata]|uniref:Uncharacterized protein n=1 Tax=Trichonephila clavata TaxID=2740835 RepID=A0A8X6FPK5_TRICU|nr:hypothetical protein TNCT_112531 [Trichonephila clavata]